MPIQRVTLACSATPSDQVLVQETGDEAVLLSMASEHYFGLDPVGTRLWHLLAHDPSLQAAHSVLLQEYEVDDAQLEHDLIALVTQLAEAGLVTLG